MGPEQERDVRAALRNAKRAQRTCDTKLEKLERYMKYLRKRKRAFNDSQVQKFIAYFEEFRHAYIAFERSAADFVATYNY